MASTSQQAALARRTILFVDDEPLSQKYFKASVGQYANVLTASTPDAALKILTSGGDPISVVVSDERMPHESGVSFLTNVRKSFPSTVRILTSAYADIENLQQAINGAAIYRFVPKPWDFDELCSAMQEALVAERVAETVAAPLEGRLGAGNAESANMELLAVLARELATPLDSLDKEALQLSLLRAREPLPLRRTCPRRSVPGRRSCASDKSWPPRRRCSAMFSIAVLWPDRSPNWRRASAARTPCRRHRWRKRLVNLLSKSQCVAPIRKSLRSTPGRTSTTGRRNHEFRAGQPVAERLGHAPKGVPMEVAVELASGADCNEVRIMTNQNTANPEFSRAVRCALWAFGGELHHTRDRNSGTATTSVPHDG